MNKLSKAYQLRDYREAKPTKERAFNSTLAAPTKPMNKVSKKHRLVTLMDGECADEALSRDGYICIAHKWLWGEERGATVVHHIKGKNTHHGVDLRFFLLYQISLCEECHQDTESQNGHSRWLDIDAIEDSETMGTQVMKQTKEIDGQRVIKEAARPNVANWNPFEGDEA